MDTRGFFVVFEGGDGVGKSTQVSLLARWFRSPEGGSRTVVETREPGGTDLGRQIRELLQDGGDGAVDVKAEALLYAADRAHHLATVVRPTLERGDVVVQDRYIDSSIVYQGGVRGLGDEVAHLSDWAAGGLVPNLTIVLDAPASARRMVRDPDRLERETDARADDLREGFLELARREPTRYAIVDATLGVEEVAAAVREAVIASLG
jgi:dTMP kinase